MSFVNTRAKRKQWISRNKSEIAHLVGAAGHKMTFQLPTINSYRTSSNKSTSACLNTSNTIITPTTRSQTMELPMTRSNVVLGGGVSLNSSNEQNDGGKIDMVRIDKHDVASTAKIETVPANKAKPQHSSSNEKMTHNKETPRPSNVRRTSKHFVLPSVARAKKVTSTKNEESSSECVRLQQLEKSSVDSASGDQRSIANDSTFTSGRDNSKHKNAGRVHTFFVNRRTAILRIVFVVTLFAAAAVCGSIANSVMRGLEEDISIQTYQSVAVSALEGAREITRRKLQSGEALSSILSFAFDTPDQWPIVALSGFIPTAKLLAALSNSNSAGFIPLVQPEQAEEFERFAQKTYQEHGYPPTAGVSEEFGFGIYSRYPNGTKYHDTSGRTTYNSKYNFLAPIFQHNIPGAGSLMFDVHSEVFRGSAIDSMVDCAKNAVKSNPDLATAANNTALIQTTSLQPKCGVVTDTLELIIRPGPACLLYQPVFPAKDPTKLVGIVGHTISFEEVLTDVVPNYVDGLHCVISTDTSTNTYIIRNGKPVLLGEGDFHDRQFTKYGHSAILNDYIETEASASVTYTLTVYPTQHLFNAFRTNSPLAVSMGFVAVIVFSSIMFFVYDFFMKTESHQRRVILDMKRRFVRFVSHEIRTPLNTVCMGLELLQGELRSLIEKHSEKCCNGNTESDKESTGDSVSERAYESQALKDCQYCLQLTEDIVENSQNAVLLLNDLLSYDRVETGTLRLEVGTVHIWDVVCKTVGQFQIQATNRKLNLDFSIRGNCLEGANGNTTYSDQSEIGEIVTTNQECDIEMGKSSGDHSSGFETDRTEEFTKLCVIGDDMRLSQVLRNLLSNALKFTPEHGTITVTACHVVNGLPSSSPLELPGTNDIQDESKEFQEEHSRAGSIRIMVKDDGAGMTHDQLKMLFNEGVQFDANKLQAGGGSGLGLFITKGIVEQHGGAITAMSEGPGLGCLFVVDLPLFRFPQEDLGEDDETDAGTEGLSHSTSPTDAPLKQNRRILVVDDALMNRKMLVRILERAGHTCEAATNGREAIDAYVADKEKADKDSSHDPFDTILIDFEMPVLNGPDATRILRDMGCTASIFGVTGNVLDEDVEYFKSHGANEVLPKPVNMALLDQYWARNAVR